MNLQLKKYSGQRKVLHLRGGAEYFDRLQDLIESATHSIHIQMYIFSYDEAGRRVMSWLHKAAAKGVQVYLLFDGYATTLSRDDLHEMKAPNIHVTLFEPIFKSKSLYLGRRLHHKIVVADGRKALVGSNNINNHYLGWPDHLPWLDMALYLEGPAALKLEQICISLWNDASSEKIDTPSHSLTGPENIGEPISMKICRNDWVQHKNEIGSGYLNLLNKAKHSIYLVSSYFLPGRKLRKQLKLATARGVTVKVITAGLSDVSIAKHAERYLYRWMLKNNILIYEYQRSILHAKFGIRDGKWLTLGSFNINNISTYASIELNLEVRNSGFVTSMQHQVDRIIAEDCVRITANDFDKKQTWLDKIIQRLCYNFIRMAVALFTFNFKREG